jgi:hypothetical protein
MKKILFLFVLAGLISCNAKQPAVEEAVVEETPTEVAVVEEATVEAETDSTAK